MKKHFTLGFEQLGPVSGGDISFSDFTVLMGPNGSGKSYIAQTICGQEPIHTSLAASKKFKIASYIRDDSGLSFRVVVKKKHIQSWLDDALSSAIPGVLRNPDVTLRSPSLTNHDLKIADELVLTGSPEPANIKANGKSKEMEQIQLALEGVSHPIFGDEMDHEFQFPLSLLSSASAIKKRSGAVASAKILLSYVFGTSCLQPFGSNVTYLPSSRSGLMLVYKTLVDRALGELFQLQEPASHSFEVDRKTTLSLPTEDFLRALATLPKSADTSYGRIADYLETVALHGHWHATIRKTSSPDFAFLPAGAKHSVQPHMASSGSVELLPLVLFFRYMAGKAVRLGSYPGTLVIEEPEAHLHPSAQRTVLRALAMALEMGFKVVVTTHSDFILQELNNLMLGWQCMAGKLAKKVEPVLNSAGITKQMLVDPSRVAAYCFKPIAGDLFEPEHLHPVRGQIPMKPVLEVIQDQADISQKIADILGSGSA